MDADVLGRIPLFSRLSTPELASLASSLATRRVEARTMFIEEGRVDGHFYVLMEGEVEVIKACGSEDERTLGVRYAGELLGEMGLFSGDGAHTASVCALTSLRLLEMKRSTFNALLRRHPQITYELVRLITGRLQESENLTIIDLKEKNRQLRIAYEELKAAQVQLVAKETLERELEIARDIQYSILPKQVPAHAAYDFGALMFPARAVGGDFYDFIELDKDHIAVVIGDVTDKGVPAALFMGMTYSLVRAEARPDQTPLQILRKINTLLLQMNDAGMFVTLIYGILNLRSGELCYARAGHTLPVLVDNQGQSIPVPVGPGQPLGLYEGISIDAQQVAVPENGQILFATDGLEEAMNAQGKFFNLSRVHQSLESLHHQPAQKICEGLWAAVQHYSGAAGQFDDFTTVVIKRGIA